MGMVGRQESVIENCVDGFDMEKANARLLTHVRDYIGGSENCCYFADYLGFSKERLRDMLFGTEAPKLYKDEMQILSLYTGIGLDIVFDLPRLSDDVVRKEYERKTGTEEIFPSGDIINGGRTPREVMDFKRFVLSTNCAARILNEYKSTAA
jgi:hypothetical protein